MSLFVCIMQILGIVLSITEFFFVHQVLRPKILSAFICRSKKKLLICFYKFYFDSFIMSKYLNTFTTGSNCFITTDNLNFLLQKINFLYSTKSKIKHF